MHSNFLYALKKELKGIIDIKLLIISWSNHGRENEFNPSKFFNTLRLCIFKDKKISFLL